jgi:site-specific recombinase XerC
MAKKTVSPPTFDKSRNRWKATIPAGLTADGKRTRSWHLTRDAAREYIDNLTTSDSPAATIPPMLAMDADKARAILEPWNLDLVQAAREVAAALEALGDAGTLLEAARAYRAAHVSRTASKPLGEAVALYLDSRADLRAATLSSYKYTLNTLLAPLHDKPMADIETADLEAQSADKAPSSRVLHRRNMVAFWTWASKPPRGWADLATAQAVESPRVSNDADIAILSADDVRALLNSAQKESPAAAAAYAIAIFAGVRMTEMGKLTWGNVGADHIEIGKAIAKKHARRLVPICPTLRAWLDAARGDAAGDAPIVPPNWFEVSKSIRRRAGWKVSARLLKNPPKPTRGPWPANSPRHTCASVQVAIGTPLEELTFKFGHSGGHDLLRSHYVSRLTKKDALAILSIVPKGVKIASISAA